jgi:hypothetical protein
VTISFEALRAAPGAASHAQVYADQLLEAGDVRGALIQAQVAAAEASVDAWLSEHEPAMLEDLGRPDAVRLCGGFARQLVYSESFARLTPLALAREPLASLVATVATPADLSHLSTLLDAQLFGLDLTVADEVLGRFSAVQRLPVVALRVAGSLVPWLEQVELPALRVLATPTMTSEAHRRPLAQTVRWLSLRSVDQLAGVLEWPQLELLDLRGVKVSRGEQARLRRWQSTGRTVLHEAMTLDDQTTFASVFSAEGRWLPRRSAHRFLAVSATEQYVSVTNRLVRGYVHGDPSWEVRLPDLAIGCSGAAAGYELACDNGAQLTLDPAGAPALTTTHAGEARTRNQVAQVKDGLVTVTDGGDQATWQLGPGVEVVVATSTGFCAATAQHVWHLVVGKPPKLLFEDVHGVRALLASGGGWVAASLSPQQVVLVKPQGRKKALCTWPRTFSSDDGGALEVLDLAVEPSGRALVALPDGALNLLDGESAQAFKPDEFEGQPYRHWVFVFDGNILVSD